MDIQALKSELVKHILATENKDLLDKLWATLNREEKEIWPKDPVPQNREVEIIPYKIENEETEDWDDLL